MTLCLKGCWLGTCPEHGCPVEALPHLEGRNVAREALNRENIPPEIRKSL